MTNVDEELVISGMSGRFPECENIDELSYNLYHKVGSMCALEKFAQKNVLKLMVLLVRLYRSIW